MGLFELADPVIFTLVTAPEQQHVSCRLKSGKHCVMNYVKATVPQLRIGESWILENKRVETAGSA